MHTEGQKSWRRVPKYRVIRTMAPVVDETAITTEHAATHEKSAAEYAECQTIDDDHEENDDSNRETTIQRVERFGKKSPKAFRVLADVMHNPQSHSRGGRMFLKQRQRLEKLAAETANENPNTAHAKHTLPLNDENARVSPWELAAISPAAVQYVTRKNSPHSRGNRWVPFTPGYHLPQPPALWRSKVEKDFPPVDQRYPNRKLPCHSRSSSGGNYVGMYGANFPPGTIHYNARQEPNADGDARWTSRFGHVERDFNARAKGWTKVF